MPGAVWRGPIPNENPRGMLRPIDGLVVHIEQGTEAGTDSWFHNPGAQASAHFGNPKAGPLDQWVDTVDEAWAESAGNRWWISVEHEGSSGDTLTVSQFENDAKLLAWLHVTEAVALQTASSMWSRGLGYHAMGGAEWGGHPDCPGQPIIDARAAIVARAAQLLALPAWPGQEDTVEHGMAVDVVVNPSDPTSGYTLDRWGGVHPFGHAHALVAPLPAYWQGLDVARRLVIVDWSRPAGYTLDLDGALHAFGGAPPVRTGAYWKGGILAPIAEL